jgi:hypothetical protein
LINVLFVIKIIFFLKDSQIRSTEIENEKQRIQMDYDEYYQRTHHLEVILI